MTCPKCRQQIPEGANFCPQCSTSLGPYSTGDAPLSDAAVTAKRWRLGAYLGLVAVLIMLSLFFGKPLLQHLALNTSKIAEPPFELAPPSQKSQPVPSIARAESTPPVLRKIEDPAPPPPILHKIEDPTPEKRASPPLKHRIVERSPPPAPVRRSAPPEVILYLRELREIEDRRKLPQFTYLITKMFADATGLKTLKEADEFKSGQENMERNFLTIVDNFKRIQGKLKLLRPPPSCLNLHNTYNELIRQYIEVIGQSRAALKTNNLLAALPLLSKATQIPNLLNTADQLLLDVCQHYNLPKWRISD